MQRHIYPLIGMFTRKPGERAEAATIGGSVPSSVTRARSADADVCPLGDCAGCPELSVVRVRHDHKNPLNIAVRDHGNPSTPGPASPSVALYPCIQI